MSADVTVASRRVNADHIWIGLILTLALLPACSPERLVLFSVRPAQGVGDDLVIVKLEVRTSLTHYKSEPPQNTANDGGNTTFPKTVGVYVHERSGPMIVAVYAYAPGVNLVAAGQREVMLTDEREQTIEQEVILVPCIGEPLPPPDLCPMPQPPDGGDAGSDANGGIGVSDAMDSPATDALEVGDGRPNDRSELGDTLDQRTILVDAMDAIAADVRVDTAHDLREAGDTSDVNPEIHPDGSDDNAPPDGNDGGTIPVACTSYCKAVLKACPLLFTGESQCERSCAFAQLAPDDGTVGDALSCRINSLPGPSDDPAQVSLACYDASLLSENCSPGACFVYCTLGTAECGDQGFSFDDCFGTCFGLPIGDVESPRSDDSVACRLSWLEAATEDRGLCARGLPTPAVSCQAQ